MISPFTKPGTKVVITRVPLMFSNERRRFLGIPLWGRPKMIPVPTLLGRVYTVVDIERDANAASGFMALVEENDHEAFCLALLSPLVLPECLTSLLHTQPHDLEVVS